MMDVDVKLKAKDLIQEYCQDISEQVDGMAAACGQMAKSTDDVGYSRYMSRAKRFLESLEKKMKELNAEEWTSLAGLAPGIELLDYLQQDLFEVVDGITVERLRSYSGASKEAVADELHAILGAMKAVKGMILETSFDWYRDNFLGLVDAGNVVWRHRGGGTCNEGD